MASGTPIGEEFIVIGAEDGTADDLKRIQKRLTAQMKVAAEAAGRELVKEFEKAGDKAGDRMLHEIERDAARINKVLDNLEKDRKITLQAELEAGAARSQMLVLQRDRFVNMWVRIKGDAAAKLTALVKGLSGASLLSSFTDGVVALGSKLPQLALQFGAVTTAVAGLAAPLLNATSAIGPLASSLAAIGPLLLAAPGLALAGAAGIGVLAGAFTDLENATAPAAKEFKGSLDDIKDSLGGLQDTIQANFFAKFTDSFKNLAGTILPQLESSIGGLSTALGAQWAGVADGISRAFDGGALEKFFGQMRQGIDAASPGFAAIWEALANIALIGGQFLPKIGEWVADIGARFLEWSETADIAGLISEASEQFGFLLDVVGELGGIIGGLFNAMDTGKSTGLESLADTLGKISDVINGPTFQSALGIVFEGASIGASLLSDALAPMGDALADLAPTIATLFAVLGGTAGDVLVGIATALASPVAQGGIQDAIVGVSEAFGSLDWDAVGAAVGAIGEAFGTILPLVAGVINAILPALPGIIDGFTLVAETLLPVIENLIAFATPLTDLQALVPVVLGLFVSWKAITGIIGGVTAAVEFFTNTTVGKWIAKQAAMAGSAVLNAAKATGAWIVHGIKVAASGVATAAKWVAQQVVMAAGAVAQAAVATAAWVGTMAKIAAQGAVTVAKVVAGWVLMGARAMAQAAIMAAAWLISLGPIGLIIAAITAIVGALVWFFTQTELGKAVWTEFVNFLGEVWTNIQLGFQAVLDFFAGIPAWFQTLWATVGQFFTDAWNNIVTFFTDVINNIVLFVQEHWGLLLSFIIGPLGLAIQWIVENWGAISQFFIDTWNNIVAFATTVWQGFVDWLMGIVDGVVSWWNGVWSGIGTTISDAWNFIVAWVQSMALQVVVFLISKFNEFIGFWSGLWNTIRTNAETIWGNVLAFFQGIPGKIQAFFSGAMNWLFNIGKDIVQGLLNGISSLAGSIGSFFLNLLPSWIVGPFKAALGIGSPSKVFMKFGIDIVHGLTNGLTKSASSAASTASALAEKIKKAFVDEIITRNQRDALLSSVASTNAALQKLFKTRESLVAKLKEKQKALDAAVKVSDDFKKNIAEGVSGLADITKAKTAEGMIANLQKQIAAAAKFKQTIASLTKMGLDDASIQELTQEFASTGKSKAADALLAGGADAVKQVADLRGQLDKTGVDLGKKVGDTLYKAGIDSMKGYVKGLESQITAIDKTAKKIADALVAKIKKTLGIKSPSIVLAGMGKNTILGYIKGINTAASGVGTAIGKAINVTDIRSRMPVRQVGSGAAASTTTNNVAAPINVIGELHPERTARAVYDVLAERVAVLGA